MTCPTRTSQITKALRAEGLPLELVSYPGYFAFLWDDGDHYDSRMVYVYRLSHLATEQWLEEGRSFAADIRTNIANR